MTKNATYGIDVLGADPKRQMPAHGRERASYMRSGAPHSAHSVSPKHSQMKHKIVKKPEKKPILTPTTALVIAPAITALGVIIAALLG